MTKKLLSLFITLTFISAFAVSHAVTADADSNFASDVDTVQLSSDSNFVIIDKKYDGILVTSHSFNTEYQLDSNEVLGALTSGAGYELLYVDESGEEYASSEDAPSEHIRDGYIRCTKEGNVIDIPIIDRGTIVFATHNGFGMSDSATNVTTYAQDTPTSKKGLEAVGGRSIPTDAIVFQESVIPAGKHPRHQYNLNTLTLDSGETSATTVPTNESFVVESNVYADGNVIVNIRFRTYPLCEWHPDGKIYALDQDASDFVANRGDTTTADFTDAAPGGKKHLATIERERWHHFALGYDINTDQVYIYIDGNLITARASRTLTSYVTANGARFGASEGENVKGTVAFADIAGYEGYYYPERSVVEAVAENSDSLVIDTDANAIKYDSAIYSNSASVKSVLGEYLPEASRIVFMKADGTVVSEASDAQICMIESDADVGMLYDYYTIERFFSVTDNEFTTDADGNVGYTATVANTLEPDKDVTAVMVISDGNSVIKKVVSSDTVTVNASSDAKTVTIEPQPVSDTDTVKVIFIDNWSGRIVIPSCIYYN